MCSEALCELGGGLILIDYCSGLAALRPSEKSYWSPSGENGMTGLVKRSVKDFPFFLSYLCTVVFFMSTIQHMKLLMYDYVEATLIVCVHFS